VINTFATMPVNTEATSGEIALNMDSINLDATLGSLQQKLDPNLVAKVKTFLKERCAISSGKLFCVLCTPITCQADIWKS
jgi:hypothetical protein